MTDLDTIHTRHHNIGGQCAACETTWPCDAHVMRMENFRLQAALEKAEAALAVASTDLLRMSDVLSARVEQCDREQAEYKARAIKAEAHHQVRCPGCGLFAIWKRGDDEATK